MDNVWQMRLYCPSCKRVAYEYDFQLEGELRGPRPDEPVVCDGCAWSGTFGELSTEPPVPAPAEPDFQI